MDLFAVSWALGGFVVGWSLRGQIPEHKEAIPCSCNCKCITQESASQTSGSFWGLGLAVAFIAILVVAALNTALAFKITWTGKEGEREFAVAVKGGKSKGVFGPPKGLQITG